MKWPSRSFALLCSCAAVPAFAQAIPPAPGGASSPSAPNESGDIIVTAQRRDEKLRDVPIAITVLTGDMLAKSGVINTTDLARITPGFTLQLYGSIPQPAIRGISALGTGLGNASNIAFYIDGVYHPNASSELMDLPDVEQIEVLKGPQGTLYGQNAAGGAIIIHTIEPSFTAKGSLSASYGSYDDKSFRGYVTGPISNAVAVSLSGAYEDRDGYRYDILRHNRDNGLESRLLRGKILAKPLDNLTLVGAAYYSRRRDGDIFAGVPIGPGMPTGYGLAAQQGVPIIKAVGPHQTALSTPSYSEIRSYGFSLNAKLETGIGDISTVTAYDNIRNRSIADVDYTAANIITAAPPSNNRDFVQELNFVSHRMSGLIVSAGLFYMNDKEAFVPYELANLYAPAIFPAPVVVYPDPTMPVYLSGYAGSLLKKSYAAYVELNYNLTDKLNITVGGRYSYETQLAARTPGNDYTGPLITDFRGKFTFKKFTPRGTIRYALNDKSNVYVSVSQGFKSGIVDAGTAQVDATPARAPAVPEVITAYEVGYKGKLFDTVTLNLAAYHYDYKKVQVFTYIVPSGYYSNAGAARVNGIDFDAAVNITPELSLSAGAAYIDAKYTSYPNAAVYEPTVGAAYGYTLYQENATGKRLEHTPRFSGNLTVNYSATTKIGAVGANVSSYYSSSLTYDSIGLVKQGHYATINGELSFAPSALKGARFVLWGKNLTNKAYLASVLQLNYAIGGVYAPPRSIGGRVEFKF